MEYLGVLFLPTYYLVRLLIKGILNKINGSFVLLPWSLGIQDIQFTVEMFLEELLFKIILLADMIQNMNSK